MRYLMSFLMGMIVATTISVFAFDEGESRYGQLKNYELRNGITDFPTYEQRNQTYIPLELRQDPC